MGRTVRRVEPELCLLDVLGLPGHRACAARRLQHAAIGEDVEADRLADVVDIRRAVPDLVLCDQGHPEVGEDGCAAVARLLARGPLDAAEQVVAERLGREAVRGCSSARVPDPAAAEVLAPGDRMVEAHRPAGVRAFVDRREHVLEPADVLVEVVPTVGARPVLGQVLRGRMHAVGDLDRCRLDVGEAAGARAQGVGQELPAGLGLDRGVNRDQAAAGVDVALERGLLGVVEHVAGRVEEHHSSVAREIVAREPCGIVGRGDPEVVAVTERPDRLNAGRCGRVLLARGLRKDQYAVVRFGSISCGAGSPWYRHRSSRQDQREAGHTEAGQPSCPTHRASLPIRPGSCPRAMHAPREGRDGEGVAHASRRSKRGQPNANARAVRPVQPRRGCPWVRRP